MMLYSHINNFRTLFQTPYNPSHPLPALLTLEILVDGNNRVVNFRGLQVC